MPNRTKRERDTASTRGGHRKKLFFLFCMPNRSKCECDMACTPGEVTGRDILDSAYIWGVGVGTHRSLHVQTDQMAETQQQVWASETAVASLKPMGHSWSYLACRTWYVATPYNPTI
jgi:hypothetical protein